MKLDATVQFSELIAVKLYVQRFYSIWTGLFAILKRLGGGGGGQFSSQMIMKRGKNILSVENLYKLTKLFMASSSC